MAHAKPKAKAKSPMSDIWRGQDIIIKFSDNISASERGKLEPAKWVEMSGLGRFDKIQLAPGEALEPLFDASLLEKVVCAAQERDAKYSPIKFENYFILRLGPGRCHTDVMEQIRCWYEIEEVYPALRLGPPPSIVQEYLLPKTRGVGRINSMGAPLTTPGVKGDGIQFGDLEEGWSDHPRMPRRGSPFYVTPDCGYQVNRNADHGRRCVGIVTATPTDPSNPDPYLSLASSATTRLYTPWFKPPIGPAFYNVAQGILQSFGPGTKQLHYGDILLIELQAKCPTGDFYLPVEITSDVYNMIRLATAYGIIVIEPAGTNIAGSTKNIDEYLYGTNSGALIVGAADEWRGTLPESNWGSRVDFFAQGCSELTVLGADSDPPEVVHFEDVPSSGTSWSAAIVAGVAVSTQGMIKAACSDPNYRLGPTAMKHLLATANPTSCADATHPIGVMPNLEAIAACVATIPDVYIRDDYSDTGSPRPSVSTASPDITIRQTPLTEIQKEDLLNNYSQPVVYGSCPMLYGRVFNHVPAGGSPAGDLHSVKMNFYFAPASAMIPPSTWTWLGKNEECVQLLPADHFTGEVDAATAITSAGYIIAVVGADEDPAPNISTSLNIGNWLEVIRNNNNIAIRAFDLASGSPSGTPLGAPQRSSARSRKSAPPDVGAGLATMRYFEIGGADRGNTEMDVEIRAALPPGTRLTLEAPSTVMCRLLGGKPPFVKETRLEPRKAPTKAPDGPVDPWERALVGVKETWTIALHAQAPTRFSQVQFPAKYRGGLRLRAVIPDDAALGAQLITIRQLLDGVEVGRFTFDLSPRLADDTGCDPVDEPNSSVEVAMKLAPKRKTKAPAASRGQAATRRRKKS